MCYAYSCRKAQRKPPHEMLSMKLPAELFRGQEKQEQKRQATVFFCCRVRSKAPFWQLQLPKLSAGIVRQTLLYDSKV